MSIDGRICHTCEILVHWEPVISLYLVDNRNSPLVEAADQIFCCFSSFTIMILSAASPSSNPWITSEPLIDDGKSTERNNTRML